MSQKIVVSLVTGITIMLVGIIWYYSHSTPHQEEPSWRVVMDKNSPKAAHEYDAIVAGGGLGGLSAGALLAKEGYKVLLLEQAEHVGGYASKIEFDGFTAFYGAEDISGAWQHGTVYYLVQELGYNPDSLFIPVSRRIILNGSAIDIPAGPNMFESVLCKMFPAEKEAIHAFFNDACKALQEIYDPQLMALYGIPVKINDLQKIFSQKELQEYQQKLTHKLDWLNKNYQEKMDQYSTNPELQKILCALLGYIGASRKTPALFALAGALVYFIKGSHYVLGGPQHLADLMANYIMQHGGTVLCNTNIEKVLIDQGNITGVRTTKEEYKAPVVISNINAKTLYTKLIEPQQLPADLLQVIEKLKMGASTVMINLGVNMDLSHMPTFIKDSDTHISIINRTSSDPKLAPKGNSSITIMYKGDYKEFPKPESPDYETYIQKLSDQAITKAESIIPDLHKHIIALNVVTPHTFERTFLIPEGAIYGFDARTPKPFLQKSPIKGLYLANASAHIGGVEAVIQLGIWVRNEIVGWKELSKKRNSCH